MSGKQRPASRRNQRPGFTLVELLVVITIIGILMSLLIPAVQSARESGRATQCANNVRQLGLGALQHVNQVGFFPSDGWGHEWIGDPDQGFGTKQPGSWLYSVLPFIEQKNLWSLGQGIPSDTQLAAKKAANYTQATTALAIYYCPSRRPVMAYPYNTTLQSVNADVTKFQQLGVGRSDYACNAGNAGSSLKMDANGPATISGASSYGWLANTSSNLKLLTGVCYQHSQIAVAHFAAKGASNEYLFGEKYLDTDSYSTGSVDAGDNECAMAGFADDNTRVAGNSVTTPCTPMQDTAGSESSTIFGSPHPAGMHMVFCDGAVHNISYSIDWVTHGNLADRTSNAAIDPTKVQ